MSIKTEQPLSQLKLLRLSSNRHKSSSSMLLIDRAVENIQFHSHRSSSRRNRKKENGGNVTSDMKVDKNDIVTESVLDQARFAHVATQTTLDGSSELDVNYSQIQNQNNDQITTGSDMINNSSQTMATFNSPNKRHLESKVIFSMQYNHPHDIIASIVSFSDTIIDNTRKNDVNDNKSLFSFDISTSPSEGTIESEQLRKLSELREFRRKIVAMTGKHS